MAMTDAERENESARDSQRAASDALLPALLLVVCAWSLLAMQALLAPRIGNPAAVALSFGAVTALVIATRRADHDRAPAPAALLCALGALAGFLSFPVWIASIGALGVGLGLPLAPPPQPPGDPLLLVAVLGLAPVFEELLYRERLLLALRQRVGATLAVALSSVCFALPHLEAWSMLATLCVGVALGALMLAGRSIALCIGAHAGLNLAAVLCGIPPTRFALSAGFAFVCGAGVLGVGLLATRARRLPIISTLRH
jgi:membrane protease YdiL (CAAX protease family)